MLKQEVLGRTNRGRIGRVNCCWSSPAQSFLVPSPAGLMKIFYTLDSEGHASPPNLLLSLHCILSI
jgi:hypothetical protein